MLDADVLINYIRALGKNSHLELVARVDKEILAENLHISSIVSSEIRFGYRKGGYSEEKADVFLGFFSILDYDDNASRHYADIRNELERSGGYLSVQTIY